MVLAGSPSPFAAHLRWWRHHRRLSQLDLAGVAGVSAKHISFLEIGRAHPSREMVVHLARSLDVPLRHRNDLLIAAGFAPAYRTGSLTDDSMADVRSVVQLHLGHHEPFPAVCVDRRWDVLDANGAASVFLEDVAPALLEPPVNVVRLSLHPDGLYPRVRNFEEYASHLLDQLRSQLAHTMDDALGELLDEVDTYPNLPRAQKRDPNGSRPMLPLLMTADGADLTLITTITTIGAPTDATTSELAIEAFYPGDETTRSWLEQRFRATTDRGERAGEQNFLD